MKKLILIAVMLSSQVYAYYDAAADYSHGAQSYDEYVLGAPSRRHEAPDTLAPTIIHFSRGTLENGRGNAHVDFTRASRPHHLNYLSRGRATND